MKNRNIQFKPTLGLLIPVLLVCFALPPGAQAVVPAPDGGYPGANTAEGQDALLSLLPAGHGNTAVGWSSLKSNTEGSRNTAIGTGTLFFNTTGINNTANGKSALENNTTGSANNAFGLAALFNNVSGDTNTAIGHQAGLHITGSNNVCIGANIFGVAGENNTTRIRNIYPSMASARAVYVNSDHKLGTLMSSRRFKDEIKPMDKASETILALKPVTFRYKREIEPNGAIMFGLIAEEVEKVAPELVTRNDKGEVETVRYDAVNAMLLNEFLKEHHKVEQMQKQIEALTAAVQKVSAQLELSKSVPQKVQNNQ